MKELKIEKLSKTYGTKTLIDQVDFAIRTGDRIGLIGPNGTGKSSLMKVIAGRDSYDSGHISHPNQYSIAYLDQNPDFDPNKTILETIYDSKAPAIQTLLAYEQAQYDLAANPNDEKIQAHFSKLSDRMTMENIWDIEVQAKTILDQLGISDLKRTLATCSGGERKRIGLAQVLIAQADLLLLDEPTNHLDVASIQWLENYLANFKGALLLITHDRYFLERSVNKIVELKFGQLTSYQGNYQAYLDQKLKADQDQARSRAKQDRLFQQELAWMRKGAKARTTKQQARIDRFETLKEDIAGRNQAQADLDFNFGQQRIGQKIMELDHVSIALDQLPILTDFTKFFVKEDRVGIVGPNGIGKSTILNTLAGLRPVQAGSYERGSTTRLAYYRQLDQDLPGDQRVINYMTEIASQFKREDGSTISVSQLLERFNFPSVTHSSQIKYLSGGEKRRLYLLSLLIQEPNILLLDEPTNDLDIETLQVLEDYLESFQGVVIIVSHDRYFLDKTVDQLLEVQGQGIFTYYFGKYSDYLTEKKQAEVSKIAKSDSDNKVTSTVVVPSNPKSKRKRLSYKEQQEWDGLEDKIMTTEAEIESVQAEMQINATDVGILVDLQAQLDQLNEDLLYYYERYDDLSNRLEG